MSAHHFVDHSKRADSDISYTSSFTELNKFTFDKNENWMSLYTILLSNQHLQIQLANNISLLLKTSKQLSKISGINKDVESLIKTYGAQNCLKSISAICDLSAIDKNKYKFMFKKFTIGKAVRLLIDESVNYYLNLMKKNKKVFRFEQIITSWIESLIYLHRVNPDIQTEFKSTILESIHLKIRKIENGL